MRRFGWLIALLVPALLDAQRVRGIVVDSALNSPISGVVVSVLDSANRVGARTITDGPGRFNLEVPASVPRLRFMRIGYRLRDVTLGANRDGERRFSMERVPPILERVQVSDTELCPGSSDRGAAFQLWDQARTGLLATIVAREAKPANATTVVFERLLSASDDIVRKQTTRVSRGRTTRPFVASSEPGVFARFGYMTEDSRGGRTFHAPDADVLLHESFALTHCFRLRGSDSAHPGQIGVAFAPAPGGGRDTLVDVSGVVWMDAASPQLRTLDFIYTSLEPAAMAARAGAHIEFRTMPNGVAFIERWVLRLPSLEVVETTLPGSNVARSTRRTPRSQRVDTRVNQIGETGGIVTIAQWEDGTVWQDRPSIVAGVVQARRTNQPVTDAVVTLEGTDQSTTTDLNGEFDIITIPGRYSLRVVDTAYKDFSKERAAAQLVTVTRGAIEKVRIELPPVGDVLEDLCRGYRPAPGSLFVAGYLATSDGSPLRGMHVRASWTEGTYRMEGRMLVPMSREFDVNDDGQFVVCGAPPLRPFQVELFKGKTKIADTTVTIMTVASTHRLMWSVSPLATPRVTVSHAAAIEPRRDSIPASTMTSAEKLRTFQAHAATQLGAYVSESALASVRGRPLVDVLPGLVKTLRVWRTADQAYVVAPSRTTEIPGFQNLSRCISDVYVDGVAQYTFAREGRVMPPNLAIYSTDAIAAVEFYAAETRVPDGLSASPCGVLVLWFK